MTVTTRTGNALRKRMRVCSGAGCLRAVQVSVDFRIGPFVFTGTASGRKGLGIMSVGCPLDANGKKGLSVGPDPHESRLKADSEAATLAYVPWMPAVGHTANVLSITCAVSRRRAAVASLQPFSPTRRSDGRQTAISRTIPRHPVTAI
jgi:hypothetical protein